MCLYWINSFYMDTQDRITTGGAIYTQTTQEVRISVIPEHLVENSDPANDVYAFSYTITIDNLSTMTVQLLERHWIILSGGVQIAEVVGPGVVGSQPVLEPGQSFQYTSGAVIHDPIGSMHGSYTFKGADEKYFEVSIPKFDLLYPVLLH